MVGGEKRAGWIVLLGRAALSVGSIGYEPYASDATGPASTLVGVDPFLYGAAAAAVGQFNRHDAKENLRVAKAILDETSRELHGQGIPNWSPPEINESNNSECS